MYNFLSIINLVLAIGTVIGGVMAYRHGFTRTANEVQERVINALTSELAALTGRIESMEKENIRLQQIISTICAALKGRGFAVTIEGDMVNISDQRGTHSERIHEHHLADPLSEVRRDSHALDRSTKTLHGHGA